MAKRFVIIRHAKSSWADLGMKDFDRPLNARGLADAPVMGKRLLDEGFKPDAIYASSSKRTTQTAEAIASAMGFDKDIIWMDDLYHASADKIEHTISCANDAASIIFIIAHNPGVTDFLMDQTQSVAIDNMPTCAIAAFEMNADNWSDFYTAKKKLISYDFPKNIK